MRYNLDIQYIVNLYLSGETEQNISKRLKVSRPVIKRRLSEIGIRRTLSEARALMWKSISNSEKVRLLSFPHDAVRGRRQTEKHRHKLAISREKNVVCLGKYERIITNKLKSEGLTVIPQKAFGRYNIDIAIHEGSIAVEVVNSHWNAGRINSFRQKSKYIINSGWLPIFIWISKASPLKDCAIKYLVALSKTRSLGKSLRSEEIMIWGDGYIPNFGYYPKERPFIFS